MLVLCVCRFTCGGVEREEDIAKPLRIVVEDPGATDSFGEKRKADDGDKFGDQAK